MELFGGSIQQQGESDDVKKLQPFPAPVLPIMKVTSDVTLLILSDIFKYILRSPITKNWFSTSPLDGESKYLRETLFKLSDSASIIRHMTEGLIRCQKSVGAAATRRQPFTTIS